MNFFGHAFVAARAARGAAYVLGAMLPDLAGMARARLAEVRDAELAAGIALHHRTDAIFHGSTRFLRLYAEAAATLCARGVARGPARGAAHVGIELLLDGVLAADAAAVQRFATAFASGARPAAREALVWRADGAARFARLHRRLRGGGVPAVYRDVERVAERVAWALASRPRLALDARGEAALSDWLAELQPQVEVLAPELVGEVETVLQREDRE